MKAEQVGAEQAAPAPQQVAGQVAPATTVEAPMEEERAHIPEPEREEFSPGPIKAVHVLWLAGMSCDGCTVAVSGATSPGLEGLLTGTIPAIPQLILHHPVLAVEAGEEFVRNFEMAAEGELDDPYVVVFEGSVPDEDIAAQSGGYWSAFGVEMDNGQPRPIPTAQWLGRLAPGAAAIIAIGTCATWGGIPAAIGNPTGAMGVMDCLGKDYRSALGLPVINVPGCAPVGDNFTETVAAILLFLQGLGPLPEFDELGRPAWLFDQTVHQGCNRAGFYEEGTFAGHYGDPRCLVEIGCWGPVVNCNIARRGAINHMGGCMNVGGVCVGCTMPGFPDRFSPFYRQPPGTLISSSASRTHGSIIRNLRRITNRFLNRSTRWGVTGEVPSGWGHVPVPNVLERIEHRVYERLQRAKEDETVGSVSFFTFYGARLRRRSESMREKSQSEAATRREK
ncbi:MAG: hydrogenase expression protein HypE [Anaerolineae bacterium]